MSPDMTKRVAAAMRARATRLTPRDSERDHEPWLFARALADRLEDTGSLSLLSEWSLDLGFPRAVVARWYRLLLAHKVLAAGPRKELEAHPQIVGEVLRAARPARPVA
jgi:hypothetical protein